MPNPLLKLKRRLAGCCVECGLYLDGWDRKWSRLPDTCLHCAEGIVAQREQRLTEKLQSQFDEQEQRR